MSAGVSYLPDACRIGQGTWRRTKGRFPVARQLALRLEAA